MYVIVIVNIILTFLHLPLSVLLLYGAWKVCVLASFEYVSALRQLRLALDGHGLPSHHHGNRLCRSLVVRGQFKALILVTVTFQDIFNEQLTMSVVEFVMSLAINVSV